MNDYNQEKEKKGGFLSSLSSLFRGGSSAMGGASSGLGSAGSTGGLAGLFATKAGIVGMVLGGATIAAGVGVVYNFIGPSSSGVYSPELFQNSYYEEESNKAGLERSKARDASSASASTLDMFKEQARKDGLGGLASEAGDAQKANASAENPAAAGGADASAAAAGAPSADVAPGAGGMPKMQAASGFGGKGGGGGGSGTSIPRMQGGGGLAGGIGAQFQPVYKAPAQANAGKTSGMTASASARIGRSPKYAVPNFNKKGAFGQAKFAGNMSRKAASYGGEQSAYTATEALSGDGAGSGNVGAPGTGAGLGGAGVANGQSLKASDPSLSSNQSTVPTPSKPVDVDPWQKWENMAMYGLLAAGIGLMITKALAKTAKGLMAAATTGIGMAAYLAAKAKVIMAGWATIIAAGLALIAGAMMFFKYGQKMMGGIYMAAAAMMIWQAQQAMAELEDGKMNCKDPKNPGTGDSVKLGDKTYEFKPGDKPGNGTWVEAKEMPKPPVKP